jgi:pimeloyl-ACP methyl ester carboxylesterase
MRWMGGLMGVVRFISNLILAIILLALVLLVLFTAFSYAASQKAGTAGLDYEISEGTWLWIDGDPIYYQMLGDEQAPAVVLVHGADIEGSATWQANVAPLVKAGLRVITVDLRGLGHSVRDDSPEAYTVRAQAALLAQVLDELGVSGATLVGHGWGNAVALQMAHDQPQFARQLVLISPLLQDTPQPAWRHARHLPYAHQAAIWAMNPGGPLNRFVRRHAFYSKSAVDSEYLEAIRIPMQIEGSIAALAAMTRAPADSDLPAIIPQTKLPTVILVGEADPYISLEQATDLAQRLPNAELISIPKAGHYPQVEQSNVVNRQLIEIGLGADQQGK